jgi:Spy/CpxP family protein refolding chaperone
MNVVPILLLAATVVLSPALSSAQGFKWWQDEKFRKELGLTNDQITRIEEVFQSALPDLRQQKATLDRLDKELSRLIDTSNDESIVIQQVVRVEQVRAELNKQRTLMLLRIRKILTADQRVKLSALHEEWDRQRKHSGDHRP